MRLGFVGFAPRRIGASLLLTGPYARIAIDDRVGEGACVGKRWLPQLAPGSRLSETLAEDAVGAITTSTAFRREDDETPARTLQQPYRGTFPPRRRF